MTRTAVALVALILSTLPVAAQQDGALSAIAQAAQQRGIKTCLPAIDRLSKNLGATFDIGIFLFNQVEQPDTGLVSISMELSPAHRAAVPPTCRQALCRSAPRVR